MRRRERTPPKARDAVDAESTRESSTQLATGQDAGLTVPPDPTSRAPETATTTIVSPGSTIVASVPVRIGAPEFPIEMVAVSDLKDHPKNYLEHPDDQVEEIRASLREHGFYRNLVIARDGTILVGHGVRKAATLEGFERLPAQRRDLDPNDPKALKILAGENELRRRSMPNDRMLADLPRDSIGVDNLLGTGFDRQMLAALVMVTRPESEIADADAAKHWVGMPEYQSAPGALQLLLNFKTEEDRARCCELLGLVFTDSPRGLWWPKREKDDLSSVRMDVAAPASAS